MLLYGCVLIGCQLLADSVLVDYWAVADAMRCYGDHANQWCHRWAWFGRHEWGNTETMWHAGSGVKQLMLAENGTGVGKVLPARSRAPLKLNTVKPRAGRALGARSAHQQLSSDWGVLRQAVDSPL